MLVELQTLNLRVAGSNPAGRKAVAQSGRAGARVFWRRQRFTPFVAAFSFTDVWG